MSEEKNSPKNVNPIMLDDKYKELREENRVVMRRTIAVNLDSFRAAPDDFDPRPVRHYPPLAAVDAPFFSVVVPTHNGLRHLAPVLEALRNNPPVTTKTQVVSAEGTPDPQGSVKATVAAPRAADQKRRRGADALDKLIAEAQPGD